MKNFNLYRVEPFVKISALCSAHFSIKPHGYYYPGESHAFWEAVFILGGKATVTSGDQLYSLSRGNVILHPPGEFHRIRNESGDFFRIAIITFDADIFPIDSRFICSFNSEHDVISVIHNVRKIFEMNGIFVNGIKAPYGRSDTQRVIASLETLMLDIFEKQILDIPTLRDENYSKAIKAMRQNLHTRLSSKEIAAMCGVSVSTLQKTFLRYTGGGIIKHYERMRMQYAKAILSKGYSVNETALSLGYSDPNYFSTAYKRYYGHAPSKDKTQVY